MREWDVFLTLVSSASLDDDAADALADTLTSVSGVLSYRDEHLSVRTTVTGADPSEALRQVRDLLATAKLPLSLESVRIEPAAILDDSLATAS